VVDPLHDLTKLLTRLPLEAQALITIARAGLMKPEPPRRLLQMALAFERYGVYGAAISIAALRDGDRPGLVDELGVLTFAELDRRSNALAHALREQGVRAGDGVGILCRNHRGMLDAIFGSAKVGAKAVMLNTDFAGPQARAACEREGVVFLVYDQEFAEVSAEVEVPVGRLMAWTDGPVDAPTIESVLAGNDRSPPAPDQPGTVVILTSGTTGAPKGAHRDVHLSMVAPGALLGKIPFRRGEATFVAPPIFHAFGLASTLISVALSSTVVMRRRFDAADVLRATADEGCSALILVPAMLDRLLSTGNDPLAELDLSALRIIFSSGSQLSGDLAARAMDAFGDVLYNLYGSTEVAYVAIGTPSDLRAAPGTAGRPPLGVTVRIYDEEGQSLAQGETGRIFVNNGEEFSGYTGGGTKEVIDGLMSTGDVGHLDAQGRLFVEGRDDDMIVSGGENVFPGEVEEVLSAHQAIYEAAAIGVPDDALGQRLQAFVVLNPGASLDSEEVKSHVRRNLARFKVPRDVIFLEALPRNAAGKVLKQQLTGTDDVGEHDGGPPDRDA
jgi:fatty-acyl-CoA synthase